MAPMPTLCIKQGATLQLQIVAQNDDGTPLDLTSTIVTAQVRDQYSAPVGMLIITPTVGQVGQLTVQQATDAWPVGPLVCDIKFVSDGIVLKSDTFGLIVESAVTP